MPSFGDEMNDDQVAAVVNYTRTHFGNRFAGDVTPSQVRSLR
jgi:mono/diheme cytochrome c family protein